MKPGAKAKLVTRLRVVAASLVDAAVEAERSTEGPPFRISVGWSSAPEAIISFDDRPVHRNDVEALVDQCIWALFESCRRGSDPGDPDAFERVMSRVNASARRVSPLASKESKEGQRT